VTGELTSIEVYPSKEDTVARGGGANIEKHGKKKDVLKRYHWVRLETSKGKRVAGGNTGGKGVCAVCRKLGRGEKTDQSPKERKN